MLPDRPAAIQEASMSQRGVERTLGKLITDDDFREWFFADPAAATIHIGVELTSAEVEALERIPRNLLTDLCQRLDGRICRVYVPAAPSRKETS
jgi:hypothetical protein